MSIRRIILALLFLGIFIPGTSLAELVDNRDGTVMDTSTGLLWQQQTAGPMTWEDALSYCENLILAGYTDWRLPNIHELRSLVDYTLVDPALDILLFPDTVSFSYWSATTYAYRTYYAWGIDFLYGYDLGLSKSNSYYARAISGGQSGLFNIFVHSSGGGSTDKDGVNMVDPGDSIVITATPMIGFYFDGWSGAASGMDNPLTIVDIEASLSVTANFAPINYLVSVISEIGGTTDKEGANTINHGGSITITAAVTPGYHFIGWSGDAVGSINPLTISNITSDMAIIAHFAVNTYTVTFTSSAGGSITGDTSQTVEHGKDCAMVTAVPEPGNGYYFTGWTGDYAGTNNPLTVTSVTSDMTIRANFTNTYTVTFAAGPGGDLSGASSQTVVFGNSCSAVTAVPDTGYHFAGWTGAVYDDSNPLAVTNVTSDMTVTANFGVNTYTVDFTAGAGGSITGALSQAVEHGSDTTTVTAVPASGDGYYFTGWTGDYTGTDNPLVITRVISDMTIQAGFANTYTVTFTAGTGGTLSGAYSQAVAYGNSCSALTAIPEIGYHFTGWGGCVAGDSNPLI
ncbi:MAG: DUF1566 domain-containing protein, partial [Deltaproteobacteria bacterium]|nr:DUF1566 domain-containing protein [Deltaproteobacteria bacterium]